jgi:hypothetical protein
MRRNVSLREASIDNGQSIPYDLECDNWHCWWLEGSGAPDSCVQTGWTNPTNDKNNAKGHGQQWRLMNVNHANSSPMNQEWHQPWAISDQIHILKCMEKCHFMLINYALLTHVSATTNAVSPMERSLTLQYGLVIVFRYDLQEQPYSVTSWFSFLPGSFNLTK